MTQQNNRQTTLIGVPADQIEAIWPAVEGMIVQALTRASGRLDALDVKRCLLGRDMQLWVAARESDGHPQAIAVTEIIVHPKMKRAAVVILTGSARHVWTHHWRGIEAWAKEKGCAGIEAWARPGWERVFRGVFKKTHVLLERNF